MRVTLTEDLDALADEWRVLFERDPLAAPFLSVEWLTVWQRHFGADGVPWLLAIRDGERLAGLALFHLGHRRSLRFLTGLGVGFGDYWDVVAAPEDRPEVLAALATELRRRSGEWDALVIDKLPEDSPLVPALRRAGLRSLPATRWPSPRIVLPDSFDAYLEGLSKNRRYRIRRNLKVLDGGELSVRELTDPVAVTASLERWQALRVQWWEKRERQMMGEHGSERFLAFTQEVVLALIPSGRAAIWEVSSGDRLVGVTVNFMDGRTFYYWLWGFDAEFEQLRPGHILIAHAIRWSIETGRRYFDFMIGDEPYKYDYAPEDRAILSMTFGNRRPRSRAALGASQAKHLLSATRSRISSSERQIASRGRA
ncbi:MAG TPA: GNAT family N-acetyltransferase [Solirubrobacteraceae bacterium]|nr:GNAT family N-acetyltransferase [Solirubrobacteraceae bacterium]